MDITQLKYFVKAAELLNITNAAAELHVAQPSLSQSISRLEAEIGAPLFIRNKKRIKLSAYGELYYLRVVHILEQLERANLEILTLQQTIDRPLKIQTWLSSALCARIISAFQDKYPYINISVVQATNNSSTGDCDIAMTTGLSYELPPAPSEVVFSEELYLAVNSNHRLAACAEVALQDAKDEPFIMLSNNRPYARLCKELCAQAGFAPNIVMENDTAQSLMHMLNLNIGIGFVPKYTWNIKPSDKIKFIKIISPICIRTVNLNWPVEKELYYPAMLFRDFVKEYFNQYLKN